MYRAIFDDQEEDFGNFGVERAPRRKALFKTLVTEFGACREAMAATTSKSLLIHAVRRGTLQNVKALAHAESVKEFGVHAREWCLPSGEEDMLRPTGPKQWRTALELAEARKDKIGEKMAAVLRSVGADVPPQLPLYYQPPRVPVEAQLN